MTCTKHGGNDSGSVYCKFCDAEMVDYTPAFAEPAGTPRSDEAYILRLLGRIADLERELANTKRKITELEENERAYERIIGPKSYQEVADELSQAKRDAERLEAALRWYADSKWTIDVMNDAGTIARAALAKREGEGAPCGCYPEGNSGDCPAPGCSRSGG